MTAGTAWVRVAESEPIQLMPGDLLLLPSGITHRLSSEPRGRCVAFDRQMKKTQMTAAGDLTVGGSGAATTFVCAAYEYDIDVAQPLMRALPEAMHVRADPVAGRDVTVLVELLAREVGERNAGARSATARLIDLLLIAAIRRWLEGVKPDEEPSWLTALGDPLIGHVLATLHDRPGERWTLDLLAREAHVSRATLARRFAETVGEPPLAYLARWRMHLAARRLKNSDDTIDTIARDVGYTSEFAFSRALRDIEASLPVVIAGSAGRHSVD